MPVQSQEDEGDESRAGEQELSTGLASFVGCAVAVGALPLVGWLIWVCEGRCLLLLPPWGCSSAIHGQWGESVWLREKI